jgi:hypothetical protein
MLIGPRYLTERQVAGRNLPLLEEAHKPGSHILVHLGKTFRIRPISMGTKFNPNETIILAQILRLRLVSFEI